jgi:hypothetical protein
MKGVVDGGAAGIFGGRFDTGPNAITPPLSVVMTSSPVSTLKAIKAI